jgi:hypothetical protein
MTAARRRLPDRRASETFDLQAQGLSFTATVSRFVDGSLAEIFLQNHKAGSMAGINAQDAAVLASLLLQHGVPLDVIRRARAEAVALARNFGVAVEAAPP